jgi:hypothetical protein
LTDRTDKIDIVVKNMLPRAPKPATTVTPQPSLAKKTTNISNNNTFQLKKENTIMSFGTLREDLSLKDVSSMVYLKIKSAAPNSVIQLPERHIVLPGLTFNHPITLIGTAATILEIVNGNILIDFRDYCSTIEGGVSGSNKQLNKVVI